MPNVEMDLETRASPGSVRTALIDFTDARPEIWPGLDRDLYEVYEVGDTYADIKEGNKVPGGAVWAKEHYDWSDPEVVTWTVQESNFCAPGSYVSAAIYPGADGGSRIHLTWNRTPISMTGRLATVLIVATRGKPVAASFRKALDKLEQAGPA